MPGCSFFSIFFAFACDLQKKKIHKKATRKKTTLVCGHKPSLDRGTECIEYPDNKARVSPFSFIYSIGKAVLQYENEGDKTLNMYHTEVPSAYRGQGIARHLAKVGSAKAILKLRTV